MEEQSKKIRSLLKKCRKNLFALEPRLAKAKTLALKIRDAVGPSSDARRADAVVSMISHHKSMAAMDENTLDCIEQDLNRVLTRDPENEKFLEKYGAPRRDQRNELLQLLERALASQHQINLLRLKILAVQKELRSM